MGRAVSLSALKVLRALCEQPLDGHYGLDLIRRSGVKASALYPILSRLESDGWVEGEWEEIDERAAGRRRRRYYRLTGVGLPAARALLEQTVVELAPPTDPLAPPSPRHGWAAP
jgi:PadR family transcriptional regulator